MMARVVSEKAEMLAGRLYDASDPELLEERIRARRMLYDFNHSPAEAATWRSEILRKLFAELGAKAVIEPHFHCDYGYNVRFGEGSYANVGCVFLDVMPITVGRQVLLGPSVHLYAATHPLSPEERAAGLELGKAVTIEDGAWLGGGTIVCPGVTVGAGAVIGAGSVVTRDVPPRVVAGGNPCRVLRPIP